MAEPAVLFDIDGTLVDTNYLHVHAWLRAFADVDLDVEAWRIHHRIGMDGSTLLDELVPDDAEDLAPRVKELHTKYYRETTGLIRPLAAGRDLLDAVADMGLQVVLATSAPEDELKILREVLDREDVVSTVTSSEDVETAKPKPDIVEVALERAGVTAERAVFLGDTVWDVRAASRAGVACIGLRSGGIGQRELEAEGAVAIYEDPRDLLNQLRDSPIGRLAAER
ncbi:HAD family hydrolase [Mycolicibacterium grossiae]|uniref:HAD family hydrolase n=1 Tax=Mycolicibacterium grossiae TaxID=1552759 RepID=A0A1E8QAU6_9MYCO|nr:HAD family hydrolase [Mycolicibacterium grossiae]OFJ55737.1 HAD family hydrolase [Mycolicibacterium grossiae]QEM43423.1 HAD family hydrolase [Mycolicibacterium grossiae]